VIGEIGLGLGRKADDEIGGERQSGRAARSRSTVRQIVSAGVAAIHRAEDPVRDRTAPAE
jgi:hypothetical protein